MLDLDDHHPGIVGTCPVLVELVGELLLNAVVRGQVEPLAVLGLEIRVGRLFAKARDRLGKVAVENDQRVTRLGMSVKSLGQEHVRSQVHGPAPELGEPLALDRLVLDVPGGGGGSDGGNHLVERDRQRLVVPGIEGDLSRRAVEVPRRLVPLLSFAAVHGQLDRVPVGAVKRLVLVKESLDAILAGGNLRQRFDRIAQRAGVDDGILAGLQSLDVDAEDLLGFRAVADLEPGLLGGVLGKHDQNPAVQRRLALGWVEVDANLKAGGLVFIGKTWAGGKRPGLGGREAERDSNRYGVQEDAHLGRFHPGSCLS